MDRVRRGVGGVNALRQGGPVLFFLKGESGTRLFCRGEHHRPHSDSVSTMMLVEHHQGSLHHCDFRIHLRALVRSWVPLSQQSSLLPERGPRRATLFLTLPPSLLVSLPSSFLRFLLLLFLLLQTLFLLQSLSSRYPALLTSTLPNPLPLYRARGASQTPRA